MKKTKTIIFALIILIALVFTSCNNKEEKSSKINFIVDGNIVYTAELSLGSEIVFPSQPVKDGYEFLGWYLSESMDEEGSLTKEYFTQTELPESLSVYARWKSVALEKPAYTITFDSNGGSFIEALSKTWGESILAPPNPQKQGFTFGGWYTDNGIFNNRYTFTVMPEENITLYAKWVLDISEKVYDLRYETDETFEVDSQNSVRYNFDVTDFLVFELLIISDSSFNAALIGKEGEIKSYQTSRVIDTILLEEGDYSLVISKHEEDTTVTTHIAHKDIITDGQLALDAENSVCLLRFSIPEEYEYNLVLNIHSDDILYDVYDEYRTLVYENQKPGTANYFERGDYYFLFHNETEYNGKASLTKKSQAVNTSIETAQPLSDTIMAVGIVDVPGTALYYSFTVETDGSLILVHAFAEDDKHIQVYVTDSNNKSVNRAGSKSPLNPSSLPDFNNEAKGEYVLPQGTYYLRVNLGTGLTGSFNISAGAPNIINTHMGESHSFHVNPNTTYYFRVYVPEKSYVYFNTYLSDNEDRYFPFYSMDREEGGVRYYTRRYNASMFTGDNYFYASDGSMQVGGSKADTSLKGNLSLAYGYSNKSDYYYVCIRAYANADGGYVSLRVESVSP